MFRSLKFVLPLALGLSAAAFGQGRSAEAKTRTITGCLESSANGHELKLGRQTLQVTGDADFESHQGHTVRVTGERQGKTVVVQSLEHVSPECDPETVAKNERQMRKGRDHGLAAADQREGKDHRGATAKHERDMRKGRDHGLTADDQGGSKADRETTAKIRKAVTDHDDLSVYAQNVKIITKDGRVTLRGPVRSASEKATVASLAEGVVGAGAVDDQLTVEVDSDEADEADEALEEREDGVQPDSQESQLP